MNQMTQTLWYNTNMLIKISYQLKKINVLKFYPFSIFFYSYSKNSMFYKMHCIYSIILQFISSRRVKVQKRFVFRKRQHKCLVFEDWFVQLLLTLPTLTWFSNFKFDLFNTNFLIFSPLNKAFPIQNFKIFFLSQLYLRQFWTFNKIVI